MNNLRRLVLPGAGFVLSCVLIILISGCSMKKNDLEIHAVKYGDSLFPVQFVLQGAAPGKTMPFSWLFYYIKYKDKKILVDTGFNNPKFIAMFNIKNYVKPSELLQQHSIRPEDITDIILTHAHFDHADGIDSFPSARIIISAAELEEVKAGRYGTLIREKFKGHSGITTFDDEYLLYDIFRIKKTGGHSAGSSVIFVDYGNTHICFTGDEVYTKENLDRGIMNGTVTNYSNNMNFIKNYDKKYIPLTMHNPDYYGLAERFMQVNTSE